jgi:hypothetical protein
MHCVELKNCWILLVETLTQMFLISFTKYDDIVDENATYLQMEVR